MKSGRNKEEISYGMLRPSAFSWLSNPTAANTPMPGFHYFAFFAPEVCKSSSVPTGIQFYTQRLICPHESKLNQQWSSTTERNKQSRSFKAHGW